MPLTRSNDFKERLSRGALELGVLLPGGRLPLFDLYRSELQKWGDVHNLTGNLSDHGILVLHFLDSLAFLQAIPEDENIRLADVGSGAGFPGIPLALARPEIEVTLIEPRRKRALFLRHMVRCLDLKNTRVLNCRVEEMPEARGSYDVAVSRAVWSVRTFYEKAAYLLARGGALVAGKGKRYEEEMAGLPIRPAIKSLRLPFDDVDRWLIILISR